MVRGGLHGMMDKFENAVSVGGVSIAILNVDGQQVMGDSVFPRAYHATETLEPERVHAWLHDERSGLIDEATLHGAVLFRGFPVPTVEAFDEMIQAFELENFPYKESLSNAVRINRTERVFSANEAPPEANILFHHEMAQTPLYPRWILFYCELAAEEGGATPICRSDILHQRLSAACPKFMQDCAAKGFRYTNTMPDKNDAQSGQGRSWRDTLSVDSRDAAEARLKALNYTWEWLDDGALKATTPVLPAEMELSPGRKTFFNQLIAAYGGWMERGKALCHGDGSPLEAAAVERAIELAEELAFDLCWQPGDFVLIDNTVAMHARRTFKGKRKVWASLAEKQSQAFYQA
jgi:alpha-ketoglutarate-dependent taurine dioxygenase